jgi:hypothetical protein
MSFVAALSAVCYVQADTIKVYNGTGEDLAVAIVQIMSKTDETVYQDIKNKAGVGTIKVYTISSMQYAVLERPSYAYGRETEIVYDGSSMAITSALSSGSLGGMSHKNIGLTPGKNTTLYFGQANNQFDFVTGLSSFNKKFRKNVAPYKKSAWTLSNETPTNVSLAGTSAEEGRMSTIGYEV